MEQTVSSRPAARTLVPFLKTKIDELNRQPSSARVSGERAAYTRLSLMAWVPFRSLARLRAHCEAHAELVGDSLPYSDGLGRGYLAALAEIDRTLRERGTSPDV